MGRGLFIASMLALVLAACAPFQDSPSGHPVAARGRLRPASPATPPPPSTDPAQGPPPAPVATTLDRLAATTRTMQSHGSQALDQRLAAAYITFRNHSLPLAARADAARTVQLASAQLLVNPDWRPGALAALPQRDRVSLQAILDAGDQLGAIGGEPTEGLPHWRIAAPAPAAELVSDYQAGQSAYGIPWQYLAAVNFVETSMGRIHGLSVAGAQGPMQFMPQTWAEFGTGDVNDPRDSILAAARYLRASGGPGDMDGALYAYNHSHHYVAAIKIFADQVAADPDGFLMYYSWDVVLPTISGPALLPDGWSH